MSEFRVITYPYGEPPGNAYQVQHPDAPLLEGKLFLSVINYGCAVPNACQCLQGVVNNLTGAAFADSAQVQTVHYETVEIGERETKHIEVSLLEVGE